MLKIIMFSLWKTKTFMKFECPLKIRKVLTLSNAELYWKRILKNVGEDLINQMINKYEKCKKLKIDETSIFTKSLDFK